MLVYLESPGSLTFEVQDVPAIVAAAKARGLKTLLDNTWSAPLFLKPLALGVDVDIISATKYIVGHSDAMMGIAVCTEESFLPVRNAATELGNHAAPDDCYLALRGLRSAGVRLRQHQKQALALAQYLEARPEVERVHASRRCRAIPGHALWRRDFTGASGLFGVALEARHAEEGDRCHARRHGALRHGRELGRLREPGAADASRAAAQRDALGHGPVPALPCRARGSSTISSPISSAASSG